MQKSRHSSFWSLLLSSNFSITSFIAFTPPSISSFVPTIVVSSANNNSRNRTSFTSLPFLSHVPVPANELATWYPSPFDPHLRFPGSRTSQLRLSQYRLVVDIELDSRGRASSPLSVPSQADKQNSYPPYHAPCTPSFHANQSASLAFSLSVHTFQATSIAGLLTFGYAFSESSNLATILSFSSLASPPVLPTLFA